MFLKKNNSEHVFITQNSIQKLFSKLTTKHKLKTQFKTFFKTQNSFQNSKPNFFKNSILKEKKILKKKFYFLKLFLES